MYWTKTTIPTLRDTPREAEIPSHQLLLRAGLVRRLTGGLYTFLPLGLRTLHKIENIVREEMDAAGALEVLMPALQPRELWEQSGRYQVLGPAMFSLQDRQNRKMVLGPTHEEVMADLASREISSYRQMPRTFYQIQTKFRDEIRPRFGLMRSKEFLMKDAYSFDLDSDKADTSYQAMYDAYVNTFTRCGLRTKIVEADTGAMGGNWSHEFMVLADSGEDGIVECESCSYAANLEKAELGQVPQAATGTPQEIESVKTPGMKTIEQVSKFFDCPASSLVKTVIYEATGTPIAVMVPGDREVNEHKLTQVLGASSLNLAADDVIQDVTGAPVGFSGPVSLSIPVYADLGLKGQTDRITGANKADTHLKHVNIERDAEVKSYHDLCVARTGDACPKCGAHLEEKRGIEVGHVFKLGTKYSKSFGAMYLDDKGQQQPIFMGSYGIGISRTLQAVIEQKWDDKGIVWPMSVAPYRVVILNLDPTDVGCTQAADNLEADLAAHGIDVLIDDRDEHPGAKFKDADLIGFPLRVVVGRRSLAKGCVELKGRTEDKAQDTDLKQAAASIIERCKL